MKRVAMIILLLAAAITMRAEEPVKTKKCLGTEPIVTTKHLGKDKFSVYEYTDEAGAIIKYRTLTVLEDISPDMTKTLIIPPDGKTGRIIITDATGTVKFDANFNVHKVTNLFDYDEITEFKYIISTNINYNIYVYTGFGSKGSISISLLEK